MQSGEASFDINCKCRVVTVVKDYPPEERYVRGDGVKPWVDYKDWKKSVVAKGSGKSIPVLIHFKTLACYLLLGVVI